MYTYPKNHKNDIEVFMNKKFGIIIATCKTDKHFAQACFLSIRRSLGSSMPVCFIVDGEAEILGHILHDTNVSVIDRNTVKNPWLRQNCFGWGITKMIAFYESPFEYFLYLDADTLVIGDILKFFDNTFDMITDYKRRYTDREINFWFFNTREVEKLWPDFSWQKFRDCYFCTGTFFSRRHIFNLDELKEKFTYSSTNPALFQFGGEMGFLNLMIFHSVQKGYLRVKSVDYQVIPVDSSEEFLNKYISPQAPRPKDFSAVIHFCGKKPHIFTKSKKVALMNFYRFHYLTEIANMKKIFALLLMATQDIRYVFFPWLKRGKRKILKKIFTIFPSKNS